MNPGRAVVGAALVVVGALLLADVTGLLEAEGIIADWWPLLLVALGLTQAASGSGFGVVSTVLIVLGVVLLGITTGLFGEDIGGEVWAVVLIAARAWVLLGLGRRRSGVLADPTVSGLSVFNVVKLTSRSPALRDGSLTAAFGVLRLDLTGAALDPAGARISTTAGSPLTTECSGTALQGMAVAASNTQREGATDSGRRPRNLQATQIRPPTPA